MSKSSGTRKLALQTSSRVSFSPISEFGCDPARAPAVAEEHQRMKVHLRFFVAAVCLVILNACATSPAGGSASLASTWTNSLGAVWTIKPDGAFEVDRNHDGKIDIRGSYSIKGDTFTIEHIEGKISKVVKVPAFTRLTGAERTSASLWSATSAKTARKRF